ncbi:PA2779 family protein [Halopseudomonas pachastrellae]|nr:PA2779 family protein [Halopseudomonas pachastrellae]
MTFMQSTKRYLSILLTALFMLTSMASLQAQAAMVGTGEAVAQQQLSVDRAELKAMLDDQEVQAKLASLGVSQDQVEQRIDSLTADELADFNSQLDDALLPQVSSVSSCCSWSSSSSPDMLCATNVYSFVNCVN